MPLGVIREYQFETSYARVKSVLVVSSGLLNRTKVPHELCEHPWVALNKAPVTTTHCVSSNYQRSW